MEKNISYQKNDLPLISVIINCYNGSKYLRDAIDSIIKQSYSNWEIIFWDNKSNDKSAEILKSYNDERIKYFYSNTHTELYAARNQAYTKSTGDYICFLDTDDYFLDRYFESQLKLFTDKSIGFACSNHFYKNQKKNKFWIRFKKKQSEGYVLDDLLLSYTVSLSTLFIKRSILPKNEPLFDGSFTYLGDFDLVIKLASKFKMARSHEPLSVYRLHDQNLSIQNNKIQLKELEDWYLKIQKLDKIKNNKNFYNIENLINYKKIIVELDSKKIVNTLSIFNKLPWSMRKLRYIVIIILVFIFGIKLKNFRL